MVRRKNQNLTPNESAVLRGIAAHHGYLQPRGPGKGEGSILALHLAIVNGDVATTSIDPDDREALAAWLREVAPSAPAHLVELVEQLARDLVYGLKAPEPVAPAPSETPPGPINTLEG